MLLIKSLSTVSYPFEVDVDFGSGTTVYLNGSN